jgi:hypothetical protein
MAQVQNREEGTVVDPLTAIAAVKQADEALGVIAKLLAKLRAQPDIAAVKLSAALDEIVKTYRVVDQALNAYASLAIDKDALTTRSQELLTIAGGSLGVQVEEGRGSCSKIGNIYREHLKRWFERAFNQEEQLAIEKAFTWPGGLGDADDTLFCELTKLVKQLENEAKDTLALVIEKRPDQAQQSVLRTYMTLAPVQQAMAQAMQQMFKLKNQLIQVAETT